LAGQSAGRGAAGSEFPAAYLDEQAMEIRLISDHRHDLVAERTRIQNRLRWHLVTLDPELEASVKRGAMSNARQLSRIDRRLRRIGSGARTRVARQHVSQIRSLTRQIDLLQDELLALVKRHRPQLLAEVGCGPLTAAILIGRSAGAQRFRTDASLALQAGTAPIKCSLGHIMDRAWRWPRTHPARLRGAPGDDRVCQEVGRK
jgi:transposase